MTRMDEVRTVVGAGLMALLGYWLWHPLAIVLPVAAVAVWALRRRRA